MLGCDLKLPVSFFSCLTLPDQQKLRVKSPVLKKQACPQWKHSFVFNGVSSSQLRQSSLELTVWDQAIFGMNDRLLGGARLGSSKSILWLYVSQTLSVKITDLCP